MDLKLHPNSIAYVRYRLNNGKEATLYFDSNGCLYDVEVESMKCSKDDCCTNDEYLESLKGKVKHGYNYD